MSKAEELTAGEMKIVRALERLEKLWKKHGENLILYNGNSLRKGGHSIDSEVWTFLIHGDGGDGGDSF